MTIRELCKDTGFSASEVASSAGLEDAFSLYQANHPMAPHQVRSFLTGRGFVYQPQTICCMNLKGGVGKTTTAVSIAVRAAQHGIHTCLVDLDPQASATLALGIEPGSGKAVFNDIWRSPDRLEESLLPCGDGLHVLPSDLENSLLDVSLMNPGSQKSAVANLVQSLRAQDVELVVIDCPPSLGAAVISAVCAADLILVPTAYDTFSLRGVSLTLEEAACIRETFGLAPVDIKILPTMVDRRLTLSRQAPDLLREKYGEDVLPYHVRTTAAFTKALHAGDTIYSSRQRSPGREDYSAITAHLLGVADWLSRREAEWDGCDGEDETCLT